MTNTTMIRFINSLNKLEAYKKELRIKTKLSLYLNDSLIGLLLSDGFIERTSPTSGARLTISFGAKYEGYFNHLYKLFEPYINTEPSLISVYNKKTDNTYKVWRFKTASLPQLIYYHDLFYKPDSRGKLVKEIPSNIEELLTPVSLAHLIMGDGNLKTPDNIIRIYTNSFTQERIKVLADAITNKFNILTRVVHDRNNQYIIVISKSQLPLVQTLIKSHMHPSMYYKLGLNGEGIEFDYNIPALKEFSEDCVDYS